MRNRMWIWPVLITMAVVLVGGCSQMDDGGQASRCPVCGMKAPEGTFCEKCCAIATSERGTVYCEKCKEHVKVGTYCPKCNRFMFKDQVRSPDGSVSYRGVYDGRMAAYLGLPSVKYCEKCEKPYAAAKGCPACKRKMK